MILQNDTIAAVATGSVLSAIGIIRLSGPGAIDTVSRVFRPARGGTMAAAEDRRLVYGALTDTDGRTLDLCLCTVSRGPHSYTGEDTAELQCHGSPAVLSAGLQALFAAGARQARPGEFTQRAFLNGRMDLTQAEAVVDLIDAQTAEAAKNAAGQLGRAVTRETERIRSALTDMMAHFHAVLDYPDEDIDAFSMAGCVQTLEDCAGCLRSLLGTFRRGQILKDGAACAVIGRPNTGKSSLMNALLGYDRAIVTDIPGTTRDTIEEKVRCGHVLLRLTDTAGIRETLDPVEKQGVERSQQTAREASLVFAVLDASQPLEQADREILRLAAQAEKSVAVLNKCDLGCVIGETDVESGVSAVCRVSARTGEGLEQLCRTVEMLMEAEAPADAGRTLLTNARQAQAVQRALESVEAAQQAAAEGITPDAVLTCVEDALYALGELTGANVREDITQRIFERFCVGK